jgi:hypothetical protein
MTREQFMAAMPGLFLSSAGPVDVVDARHAYEGCANRAAGILGGARFDGTFRAEEVTNNDPGANGIGSVIDAEWRSPGPYRIQRQLASCSQASERWQVLGVPWTVVRGDGTDLWAAAARHGRSTRLLLVASSASGVQPDEGALARLQRTWLR